jgi:hypothetical protein
MSDRPRQRGAVGAVILVGLGVIFLLNNFGYLGWEAWEWLWRFWPLVLILWGLQIVFGRNRWGNLAVGLIGLVLFALLITYVLAVSEGPLQSPARRLLPGWGISGQPLGKLTTQTKTQTVTSEDFSETKSRLLDINLGVDRLKLTDTESSNLLNYEARFQGDEPTLTSRMEGDILRLELTTAVKRFRGLGLFGERNIDAVLGRPEVPTSLSLNIGTGKAEVSLDQLNLTGLSLNVGTGVAEITLGSGTVPSSASVDIGTGSITLNVPKNIGLKITRSLGIGSLKIGDDTLRGNGTTKSDNYDSAERKLDLALSVGTGSITVNQI